MSIQESADNDGIGKSLHWCVTQWRRRWLTLTDFTRDYLLNAEEDMLHTDAL